MWLRATVLCLLMIWLCPAGRAADVLPGPTGKNKAQQQARLKENARILYYSALKHRRRDHPERLSLTQQALLLLQKALLLEPTDVEARVWLGEWMSRPELGSAALSQAVKELQQARRDDATGSWDFEIATQLGIVLSHLGRFEDAVGEYDRALRLLPGEPDSLLFPSRHQQATLLSNSAEALMAMGKLGQAIRRYSQAEHIDTGDQGALHALGLAVAYDRDGQVQKSHEALSRSLAADPGLRVYQGDEVFFVPDGDRYYYDGLIAEGLGNRDEALRSFRQFTTELPKSRYTPRAREHLEELQKLPGIPVAELFRANVLVGSPHFAPEDSAGGGEKHRSEDEVGKAVRERMIDLRQCYAQGLRRAPRLGGDMLVALIVDPSGAVLLVQPLDNTLTERGSWKPTGGQTTAMPPAAELVRCVQNALQRFRFPVASVGNDDNDELALPIHFEAR
jgi:tetratricopeptide (TPR) repeat protein